MDRADLAAFAKVDRELCSGRIGAVPRIHVQRLDQFRTAGHVKDLRGSRQTHHTIVRLNNRVRESRIGLQVVALDLHIVQRQVSVVLDHTIIGVQCCVFLAYTDHTIFEYNGGILQQLEYLVLRAGRASARAFHCRVGMFVEVDRDVPAGWYHDAHAGAVSKHFDRRLRAVRHCRKGSFQSLVLGLADLGDVRELAGYFVFRKMFNRESYRVVSIDLSGCNVSTFPGYYQIDVNSRSLI